MTNDALTIELDLDSELGRALDAAEQSVVLVRNGVRYRVSRDDHDITAGYEPDPEQVRATLAATAGSWADLDIDQVIRDLYEARKTGSRPPERP